VIRPPHTPPGRVRSAHLAPLATLWIVLIAVVSCSAPASVPAEGPVAEQVRASFESGAAGFDHAAWDRLLAEGTEDGLVDYRYMMEHRAALDGYLERVAAANLAALHRDHLMALLMNAYNALTVRSILDAWPVDSIREIDGVWSEATHTVGGVELTLDQIEHNLLRPFWRDPRIHFGVNCASASCAPLPPWAFDGDSVDEQLDERTEAFLSSPDNVRIEGDALQVSRYFDWYGDDFTAGGWEPRAETIPAFIAEYTRPEVADFIESSTEDGTEVPLRFLDYDWSLNAAGRSR
jgi:hypothetical protein